MALIGAVEKGEASFSAGFLVEVGLLGLYEVDVGGVMCASVEKDDASPRRLLDGGVHSGEVHAFGLGRKVRICLILALKKI